MVVAGPRSLLTHSIQYTQSEMHQKLETLISDKENLDNSILKTRKERKEHRKTHSIWMRPLRSLHMMKNLKARGLKKRILTRSRKAERLKGDNRGQTRQHYCKFEYKCKQAFTKH